MNSFKKIDVSLRSPLLLSILGMGILCAGLYKQQSQKDHLNSTKKAYQILQKEAEVLEKDIIFLTENRQQLQFLVQKGWLLPKSRLLGGTEINRWAADLNELHFRIEPEIIKEIEAEYAFRISKVMIKAGALLDTSLYDFAEKILKNFPGILVLRKLVVRRNTLVDEPKSQNKQPCFVIGEFIFDWFAMIENKNDKDRDF